jgi:hypothetical protein
VKEGVSLYHCDSSTDCWYKSNNNFDTPSVYINLLLPLQQAPNISKNQGNLRSIMYPRRTHCDSTGRENAARSQPTFISSGGPPRRTESSRHSTAPDARSSSTRTAQPTNTGGRTTIVRPGEPHWFGTRADFQNCRLVNNLCRCQNPDAHGDAWKVELPGWYDISGRPTTVQQIHHRILDHYGTATVAQEQELVAYRLFCAPCLADSLTRNIRSVEFGISMGIAPRLSPHADVTHYYGDGHAQDYLGQGGLQTVMPGRRGGAAGGRGGNVSSYGHGSRR